MPDGSLVHLPTLPVAVIGAGPVGLAAAANLRARGLTPLVLEAGGWTAPDAEAYPTGTELADLYLAPLAQALGGAVRTGARVVAVSRRHHDLMRDAGRGAAPFLLHVAKPNGEVEEVEAAAVIDCSGTWDAPNPAGPHGLPAPGEAAHFDRIAYGIPDVLGTERETYAGRSVLVVGAGHSAMNVVLGLARLAQDAPGTRITWAFRKPLGLSGSAAASTMAYWSAGRWAPALMP